MPACHQVGEDLIYRGHFFSTYKFQKMKRGGGKNKRKGSLIELIMQFTVCIATWFLGHL